MPYKVVGNKVMHKKNDHWTVKQKCASHANAVKAVRLLQAVKRGWKPTKAKK